jgi:hypothetical protein
MDGIFHAAFVSARMALTMERVALNKALRDDMRREARLLCDQDIQNYKKAAAIIRAHAHFSATGLAVFSTAENAMRNLLKRINAGFSCG